MSEVKIQEVDKRLLAHESACAQRWQENYRRLDSIETSIKYIGRTPT